MKKNYKKITEKDSLCKCTRIEVAGYEIGQFCKACGKRIKIEPKETPKLNYIINEPNKTTFNTGTIKINYQHITSTWN